MSTLFAFFHHVAAFTLVSALAVEFVLAGQELSLASARRLVITDAVLGGSAAILLVIGLLRVFFFEKGASYYFHSHAFMTKLSVFIAVALISIVPTLITDIFTLWRSRSRSETGAALRLASSSHFDAGLEPAKSLVEGDAPHPN